MHHEGEVVLKEKYGSSVQQILYVKPHNQSNIVLVNVKSAVSSYRSWFTALFLPQGFPDSVSPDYIHYQLWDTAQAFCSTITGTLATQEVLRGVGVGDTSASPIAATITWVIKDGCGHMGRIWFAWSHGTYLDAYSKKWRLYADCLNDAAICMEMALPYFRSHTTLLLCTTSMMKAVVGVAGGATRAALTQHHAIRFNMADVAAKDSAQETAVNLIASLVALAIITVLGNSMFIFCTMVVLHIVFNYFAVRSVCLRTFNEPRLLQAINRYLRQELVSAPCEINRQEPIIFYQLGQSLLDLKLCGFQIKLGQSIRHLMRQDNDYNKFKAIKAVYSGQKYMLYPNTRTRRMYVIVVEDATSEDIIGAYFHAVLLSVVVCSINFHPLTIYKWNENLSPFSRVCRSLQTSDWSRDLSSEELGTTRRQSDGSLESITFNGGFKYNPSIALLGYVNDMAQTEWSQLRLGLRQTGWNLDKHLLMIDEWRIEGETTHPRAISTNPVGSAVDLQSTSGASAELPSGAEECGVSGEMTAAPQLKERKRFGLKHSANLEAQLAKECVIEPDSLSIKSKEV